ncbi:MAG: hypothetical protein IPJ65_30285 [Archangiaceae bacterium]|nr:hypothetical protein [Archangiaceae bacterium]
MKTSRPKSAVPLAERLTKAATDLAATPFNVAQLVDTTVDAIREGFSSNSSFSARAQQAALIPIVVPIAAGVALATSVDNAASALRGDVAHPSRLWS